MAHRIRGRRAGVDADPAGLPVPGESVGVRGAAAACRVPGHGAPSEREQRRQRADGESAGEPAVATAAGCVGGSLQQPRADHARSALPCGRVCRIRICAIASGPVDVGVSVRARSRALRNDRVFDLRLARWRRASQGVRAEQPGAESRCVDRSGAADCRAEHKRGAAVSGERCGLHGARADCTVDRGAKQARRSRRASAAWRAGRVWRPTVSPAMLVACPVLDRVYADLRIHPVDLFAWRTATTA